MTTFDPQLAKEYYQKVYGNTQPMLLSDFITNLNNRTYNLMTKTDTIEALRDRFGVENEYAGGVYTFWWLGSADILNKTNSCHKIKGKKESAIENERNKDAPHYDTVDGHIIHTGSYHFNEISIDDGKQTMCPLYVGKTSWVRNRIRLHLQWPGIDSVHQKSVTEKTDGPTPIQLAYTAKEIFKHTTACQFRAGFEFLFRGENAETRKKYLMNNIAVSIATTPEKGGDGFEDRFFTEDLLIGAFRAPFNLDSER